jgi:glycosyltransferase
VAAQRHDDIEHIVIDGGSRDATMDTVRRHRTRVALSLSEPDRGIYDAMNKGLALATGDLVGFLNADDVLNGDHAVQRIVEAAAGGADVVYGDLVYVDTAGQVVRYWRAGEFAPGLLGRGWMPPHPTFYASRRLLAQVGAFDDTMRVAADYDFMVRCLTWPGVHSAYTPHTLVRMRLGGASNAGLTAMWRKSSEDLAVIRRHGIGGIGTLLVKNVQKLPQFLGARSRAAAAMNETE